jgi:hypothetical protein
VTALHHVERPVISYRIRAQRMTNHRTPEASVVTGWVSIIQWAWDEEPCCNERALDHKVHIYQEYNSVCPLVGIGTPPPPLPQASVYPPPR